MSQTVKTPPVDPTAKAKRSWLSEFLGITLPWDDVEEPQEPEAASDPRAVQAAHDLINLHGEAVALGLELGGQREALKAQVQQQILDGQYDAAEAGIGTLRDALGQARQDKAAWDSSPFADAAKQVDALASDGDPKAGELQAEQQRLAALAAQQQFKPAAEAVPAFVAAVKARRDLYPARKDWLAGAGQREATRAQADEAISWGADLAAGKARLAAMATEATDEANNYAALIAEHDRIAKDVAEAHGKQKAAREAWLEAAGQLDPVEKQVAELDTLAAADAATQQAALDKVKADAAKPDFDAALKGLQALAQVVEKSVANARAEAQTRADKAAWDTSGFAAAAGDVAALAGDGDPQAGTLQAEQKRLEGLAEQQQFKPAAEAVPAFVAAVKARRDLYPARKDWLAGAAQREATMAQADEAISWGADLAAGKARLAAMATEATDEANNYAALIAEHDRIAKDVAEAHAKVKADREKWLAAVASQLDTVEKNVAELTKAAAADAATHKAALDKVKADAAKPDFAAALKGLETLAPLVAASLANAQAKTNYEAQRKALADDEAAVLRIGDTPPELKALKDTYLASVAKTKESVDKGEFANAVTSLTQLKVDLKAALGAKRTGIETATRAKVDDAKAKLGASGTGGKKVWADVGSDAWKAAVDQILTVQLDEDFVARYDATCGKVADDLAKDPVVQEGFKKWSTWTKDATSLAANADKIEDVMKKVLELQSKQLGIDPPTPVGTYSNPSDPGDCGGFSGSTGRISLNSSSGDFGDFKELLDTLTHENTHAYQEKLIKAFRAGAINPGDPDYNAAMALELNDNTGYVSPDESDEYQKKDPSKNPYKDQVCEVQAWRAGRMAGQEAFKKLKAG